MSKTGRPSKYSPEVNEKAKQYLAEYHTMEVGRMIPSIEGFSLYLGVNRTTLYEWAKHHEAFSNTLAEINTQQKLKLLDGGLSGDFNSNITKLALGNHGMSDKQDVTSGGEKIQNEWHIHPVTNKHDGEG